MYSKENCQQIAEQVREFGLDYVADKMGVKRETPLQDDIGKAGLLRTAT